MIYTLPQSWNGPGSTNLLCQRMLLGCSVVLLLNAFLLAKAIDDQEINNATTGCPHRAFIGCILQLKEEHIQFDRNIVRVILGVNSEAKLLHTCKSYTNVLPCFRARVLECGNDQQKDMLIDVGKALMFLCSPFSLTRQRTLIRHQACMAKVLSLPISAGCKLNKKVHADRLDSCKRHCSTMPKNFTCSLQTWISEQNACTLNDLIDHCGEDAANFYSDLQASIFEPSYPFICQHVNRQFRPQPACNK
ncbi:hypothetical protein M3Y97_00795100 [Aphelenchoides bicaudatus]|nr:hypothetical protein M3Y97_00795100 [Aphelenchoides bicaudatus]